VYFVNHRIHRLIGIRRIFYFIFLPLKNRRLIWSETSCIVALVLFFPRK